MKPLYPLLLFLALTGNALGTTFTVISNADSGPGSFRDALQQAAANGSASADQIVFNLPDLSTAGRTITLLSALPDLSSNLTIDGTTQPGTPFGISAARVMIRNDPGQTYFSFFQASGLNNISVYGLYLQGYSNALYCFNFQQSNNLQFGAPGKGNIIDGFYTAFYCQSPLPDPGSNNIVIQGNLIGIDATGANATPVTINFGSFQLRNVGSLQIGGLNPGEGNHMAADGYSLDYQCTQPGDYGYLNFQGNTDGTDMAGLNRLPGTASETTIMGYASGSPTGDISVNVTGNITAGGFEFTNIEMPILVQGNHLGVAADNVTNLINGNAGNNLALLEFTSCKQALVGGAQPADRNYIAYDLSGASENEGILEVTSGNITISQNSIFCNGTGILIQWAQAPRPQPFVNINSLTAGLVGGNALPGSTIELFYDDECPGCEGKTYIGSTTADNTGKWSYALTPTGAIVATATDTYGATSQFSTATLNTDSVAVQNATCGLNNGSIRHMKVVSGTEWYWTDAAGNIVSNDTDLINVLPGTYTLVTSIGGASCSASSTPYTITNVDLPAVNPGDITITQPGCGVANGAFLDGGAFDPIATYVWLKGGAEVCPDFTTINPFKNLAPGAYVLQVALKQNPNCFMQYPYTLVNQSGPTLDTSDAIITPATCGLANGSITNLSWQNATGTPNVFWEDSTGLQRSNDANLFNVTGGPYRFSFSDGSGCGPIVTSWFRIPNLGSITNDTSKMVITPSNCGLPNGAITGIIATDVTTFTWTNAAGQTLPASTIDISGLAAGTYFLAMSNGYGCQAQTQAIIVPLLPEPAFDYSNLQTLNDTCNSGSGAVRDLDMIDPARTYTWAWTEGSQPQPAGNSANHLDSLKAGTYRVTVTDATGCSVTSEPFTVQDIEYAPDPPQVSDLTVARNTSATIVVANPHKGTYDLLDGNTPGATILATSTSGTFHTTPVPQDETLYVQFTRGDCGSAISPVNIKVFDSVKIYIPNAFSPNTGANNRWRVIASGPVRSIHISVYDRYGQEVFAASSLNDGWDGTTAGHPSAGTFAYLITGTDYYDRPFHLTGTIIVIR